LLVGFSSAARRAVLSGRGTVHFGRMQEAEIQTTARFGRQSVMQYRFPVMSVGRPLELISLRAQRILSHDEPI
jgi:hypothetical protein